MVPSHTHRRSGGVEIIPGILAFPLFVALRLIFGI